MASQTPGIQQLLLAEKKASEKVGEARKGKLGGGICYILALPTMAVSFLKIAHYMFKHIFVYLVVIKKPYS